MIAQTEGGQGTYSKLRGVVRKVGMGPFRNSIKAAGRRAVSHVRAARRVLARARRRRVQAHLFDAPSPMAVLVRDAGSKRETKSVKNSPSARPQLCLRAQNVQHQASMLQDRIQAHGGRPSRAVLRRLGLALERRARGCCWGKWASVP